MSISNKCELLIEKECCNSGFFVKIIIFGVLLKINHLRKNNGAREQTIEFTPG